MKPVWPVCAVHTVDNFGSILLFFFFCRMGKGQQHTGIFIAIYFCMSKHLTAIPRKNATIFTSFTFAISHQSSAVSRPTSMGNGTQIIIKLSHKIIKLYFKRLFGQCCSVAVCFLLTHNAHNRQLSSFFCFSSCEAVDERCTFSNNFWTRTTNNVELIDVLFFFCLFRFLLHRIRLNSSEWTVECWMSSLNDFYSLERSDKER